MVPLAPGFFSGRKGPEGYWPYIRDVLIPAQKASAHFSMGDTTEVSSIKYFKELATNSYPSGSSWPVVSSSNAEGSRNISTSGGPISGRGYLESTSATATTRLASLAFKPGGDATFKDNMWFALAYWPTNPQVANGSRHCILSFIEWFPQAYSNWPWSLYHASGSLDLILNINNTGDYTPDIVLNCGTLTLGAWNHIIVRHETKDAPNNGVTVQLNGTRYSTTRSFDFPTPNPQITGIQLLSAMPNAGGADRQRALGRIAELTFPYAYTAGSLITNDQMDELWAAFQLGV